MTEWLENYNGMRGRWKYYFFRTPERYLVAKVFQPLASDECPHDNYTVNTVEGANHNRWLPPKSGKDSQFAIAYISCDDCGTYGEVVVSLAPDALKQSYNTIDWQASRGAMYIVLTDPKTGAAIRM